MRTKLAFLLLALLAFGPAAQAQSNPKAAPLTPPAASASRAQVRQYARAVAGQVDLYWKEQAAILHFSYTAPQVRFTTNGDDDGPCDGTMMFDSDTDTVCLDLSSDPDDGDDSFVENVRANQPNIVAYSVGHEWGHHIQKERHQESVKDVDINVELQADCYAGMFLTAFAASGSLTPNGLQDILNDARESGDDPSAPVSERDHGRPKQRADAVKRGYNGTLPAACDPIGTTTPDR